MSRRELLVWLESQGLTIDEHGGCAIFFEDKVQLYLTVDRREFFILSAHLGIVPPGRYRENLFASALQKNESYTEKGRIGIFGYDQESSEMLFFQQAPLGMWDAEGMEELLSFFGKSAIKYQDCLARGSSFST